MAQVIVEDPDVHKTAAKVDSRGRVYLNSDLEGQRVTVVAKANGDGEEDGDE